MTFQYGEDHGVYINLYDHAAVLRSRHPGRPLGDVVEQVLERFPDAIEIDAS